jgi:IS30 family transposase
MLGREDFMLIQALVKRGVYVCDIARQLGVHPKTVGAHIEPRDFGPYSVA